VRSTLPIQSVLMVIFFLSIGLLIDRTFGWNNMGTVILLLATVTLVKTIINIGIVRVLQQPWPNAFVAGVLLAQIVEFSLIISQVAQEKGILAAESGQLIVTVIAFSLLMSPVWIALTRRLVHAILLSVTSLRGTLKAIETHNMVVFSHYILARYTALRRAGRRLWLAKKVRHRQRAATKTSQSASPLAVLLTDQRDEESDAKPAADIRA